jgi:hypothetical protein
MDYDGESRRGPLLFLQNGKVLITGGLGAGFLAGSELYDPVLGSWNPTGSLSTARDLHTAVLLPNGKVLVAAGAADNVTGATSSAELYDPATGDWNPDEGGALATERGRHTATLLTNGKVLVVGGVRYNPSTGSPTYFASSELYDPTTRRWSATGALPIPRAEHTATLLPSGKVLVTGGRNSSGVLASSELYDPATGSWSATGGLANACYDHTATLLPNGKVLVAGGRSSTGPIDSAELYDPGLGFADAWRPHITSASFDANARLVLTGTGFRGISSASGGNSGRTRRPIIPWCSCAGSTTKRAHSSRPNQPSPFRPRDLLRLQSRPSTPRRW